ncbi:MAG TPA: DUF488 family protein [Dehalococcoidia bacterium]|nr:DUF488 family protein [Dehalococcoidia bacterium]
MTVTLKRAYDEPAEEDGERYLVERLWPRGIKKEALNLTAWLKDVAPSTELRRWYGHQPERWPEFSRRYREELRSSAAHNALEQLVDAARKGDVTLVFAARDTEHSGAEVLKEVLEEELAGNA